MFDVFFYYNKKLAFRKKSKAINLATQASQGSVTWTWDEAREAGNYIDGPVYVIVPSGTITINEPTPQQITESGFIINGAMKNPVYNSLFAFDQRNTSYNGAGLLSFPVTVTAGDIIVKAVSEPYVTNQRAGLIREYSALYIVSEAPDLNEFAPVPWGWSGRGTPVGNIVDVDAALAARLRLRRCIEDRAGRHCGVLSRVRQHLHGGGQHREDLLGRRQELRREPMGAVPPRDPAPGDAGDHSVLADRLHDIHG